MNLPQPIGWNLDSTVRLLDQTLLPTEERYVRIETVEGMAEAIGALRTRGAPLIGVAAAMGMVLALRPAGDRPAADARLDTAGSLLIQTRPTAINLAGAVRRMLRRAAATAGDLERLRAALTEEASTVLREEQAACEAIGRAGQHLVPEGAVVCTICNAGVLATGGLGTATAPMYTAARAGRRFRVLTPETRPLLQGSRLTAWELGRAGISCTVLTDNMVAARLAGGDVTCAIVGADRVAANGDVANKIGTYALAVAAERHQVPLYVALPDTTFDPDTPDGAGIPIEQRASIEVSRFGATRTAPEDADVWNPAFDVTPAALVTGYLTPAGLVVPSQVTTYIAGLRR